MPLFLLAFLLVAPQSRNFPACILFAPIITKLLESFTGKLEKITEYTWRDDFTHSQQFFCYFTPQSISSEAILESNWTNQVKALWKGQYIKVHILNWRHSTWLFWLTTIFTWRHVCLWSKCAHKRRTKISTQ